ncbi:hypothetical protein BEN47_15290 [Hymenobacter lapidarius]|uniref:Peptidase C39-like domain-containing protein n=1 Tax=Hymenobacter lapidarius TaxID=1908237 RepID=A0A1G1T2J3_9BACT|nr:hypothetical protein BEN47_15290 [Hymenobacter lapidarius]
MPIRVSTKTVIPIGNGILRVAALNVPMIMQEQSNWCWAACADMLLYYYGNPGVTQCQLANWAFGQTACCQIPSSTICNQPLPDARISQLLTAYGLRSSYSTRAEGFGTLVLEIGAGRPVEVGLAWRSGGGHVVLVVDAIGLSGRQVVRVNDPAVGSGGMNYSDLQTAYGQGVWDATWVGIQR